jgi:hypothetical protein
VHETIIVAPKPPLTDIRPEGDFSRALIAFPWDAGAVAADEAAGVAVEGAVELTRQVQFMKS